MSLLVQLLLLVVVAVVVDADVGGGRVPEVKAAILISASVFIFDSSTGI